MQIRDKSPVGKELISSLERLGRKKSVWKAVAKGLNRPRRVKHEVSLVSLDKLAGAKDTLVVPGKVLGNGETAKKITVAAMGFSDSARDKIEKAGGSVMTIQELIRKNPEGKGVRIVG